METPTATGHKLVTTAPTRHQLSLHRLATASVRVDCGRSHSTELIFYENQFVISHVAKYCRRSRPTFADLDVAKSKSRSGLQTRKNVRVYGQHAITHCFPRQNFHRQEKYFYSRFDLVNLERNSTHECMSTAAAYRCLLAPTGRLRLQSPHTFSVKIPALTLNIYRTLKLGEARVVCY